MRFFRRSLTLRIYVTMLATLFLTAVLTLILLLFVPQLPGLLASKHDLRLATSVAIALEGRTEDTAALEDRVRFLADAMEANIAVIRDGQVIAAIGQPMMLPSRLFLGRGHIAPPVVAGGGLRTILAPIAGSSALVMVSDSTALRVPGRALVIAVFAAVIAALMLFPITRSIRRPLAQLLRATEAVGEGTTVPRLGIKSEDEVGRLARAFDAMAERIETARRAERELIANVSHEVRTPIARVRMAMALVDTRDPEVARRLGAVELELGELQSLTERLLEAARLDAASLPVRREVIPLRPLLDRCRDWLLAIAPERSLQIDADPSLTVLADEELLARVFHNLLDNAHKYDPSGAPIRIESARKGKQVLITVRDQGRGIPVDDRERVFQAFYRGADARVQSASGFGVGLALARRIVVAHEGVIRIIDQAGGGAAVEVTLPVS